MPNCPAIEVSRLDEEVKKQLRSKGRDPHFGHTAPTKAVQVPAPEKAQPNLQGKSVEQETEASVSPAGKIQFCLPIWRQITQDPWVLEVVNGNLVQTPSQINPVTSVARSPAKHQAIGAEIQALLIKGAVRMVRPQSDQFTSRLFVIPKKDGSLRLVINLKPLNKFIANQHFKMEG